MPPTRPIAGGQAAAVQGQLNFSRDMEREADRIGFGVLDRGRLRAGRHGGDVREARPGHAAQRQRRLPLPAQPPADHRAHRRGALAPGHLPARPAPGRAAPLRARADAGARAGADGHARRCAAPLAGAATRRATTSPRRAPGRALQQRAGRRCCCATAARAEARSPARSRCSPTRRAPESAAERGVAMLQAQARLARGDAAGAEAALQALGGRRQPRRAALMAPTSRWPAAVARPRCAAAPKTCRPAWRTQPGDALAWRTLAPAVAAARPAAARRARRGRGAPTRSATCAVPSTACAPASAGARRRSVGLHRSLGDRRAAARHRGAAARDRGRGSATAR